MNKNDDRKLCKCHLSAEQSRQSERTSTLAVQNQGTSLARRFTPETPSSKSKTDPQMPRPLSDHPRDIPGSLSPRTTHKLESSQCVPCVLINALS